MRDEMLDEWFDGSEVLIPLVDVCGLVPSGRPGKRVSRATVFRWALKGVKGVKLATKKSGGTRVTTRAALRRFIEQTNAPNGDAAHAAPSARKQRPFRPTEAGKRATELLDKQYRFKT